MSSDDVPGLIFLLAGSIGCWIRDAVQLALQDALVVIITRLGAAASADNAVWRGTNVCTMTKTSADMANVQLFSVQGISDHGHSHYNIPQYLVTGEERNYDLFFANSSNSDQQGIAPIQDGRFKFPLIVVGVDSTNQSFTRIIRSRYIGSEFVKDLTHQKGLYLAEVECISLKRCTYDKDVLRRVRSQRIRWYQQVPALLQQRHHAKHVLG